MSDNPNFRSFTHYQQERTSHWDGVAQKLRSWKSLGAYYNRRLADVYKFLIPPGQRILEIGCGRGDLLAAIQPAYGVGVDFSSGMVELARENHPGLQFIQADAHHLQISEKFDYIILSDVINDLWDVQEVFRQLQPLCHPGTRIILNYYSRLWEYPLMLARSLNLATPLLYQNWLTRDDVINLLYISGFEVIRNWEEVCFPINIPLLAPLFNRFLVRFWPFKLLAMANFSLARPKPTPIDTEKPPQVSVVVPARNEAGNIEAIFNRTPEMGSGTQLIFVEGNSRDDTYETIARALPEHPERNAILLKQPGKGKGDAVRTGFASASGDILMILDADLTMPPEDLPRYYEAIVSGRGEMINGVRLVYPMEKEAMRFFNLLGNKFFSLVFTWLLGQPIKDTLCGTKVLWRKDYDTITANRAYFGDFDPFGDFDLLFGAAKQNRKIIDIPIRYRERTYGETNIDRWRHGVLLLKMVAFAARRIKFI